MSETKICPACNSEFKTIYYQRRAADEPPDKVVYCQNCPLDTNRLKLDSSSVVEQRRNSETLRLSGHRRASSSIDGHSRNSKSVTSLRLLQELGYRIRIRAEGLAAARCYKMAIDKEKKFYPVITSTTPNQTIDGKQLIELHKNSIVSGEGYSIVRTSRIAPLVFLDQLRVYKEKQNSINNFPNLVTCYETQIDTLQYSEFTVLRTLQEGKQPSINVFLNICSSADNSMDNVCLSILQEILYTYGTENTIKSFISSQLISTLFVQSGKAYDWPSAPSQGYVYTWKPDGERFWYLKYGSVWLFSRRLLSGRITGWNIANSLLEVQKVGPILDVEVLIGHEPILIDVLVLESGKPTQPLRSLDLVLDTFRQMTCIDIPIFVRDYYKSQKELLHTKKTIKYPTDGVVGIQDGSMTIIKLKEIKSIELKLEKCGNLISSEGTVVATSALQEIYSADSIIEIRFVKQVPQDIPTVTEILLRTDKTKANSYDVCKQIISTAASMPDILARRGAVQWCNSIRQKINQIASKTTGKGRVILDIGAGDGQAIADYATDSDITYVLIEPNVEKCEKLIKRLSEPGKGSCKLFIGSESITKAISLTSNKTLKYAVVCTTLGSILKEKYIIRTLKSSIRYCIAVFSISYISKGLQNLALNGIDVIGCGYMYDSVNSQNVLVDESGVLMKLSNHREATVRWGKDKEYKENAIRTYDFKEVFHLRLAKDLVPVFNKDDSSLLTSISSKVYVISTKKHI